MYFDTSYINTMFTGCHIVSAASSPGRRLAQALWLCRGLGQAWHLLAAKTLRKASGDKKMAAQRIEVAKGKYARTCVCLTKKTTDLKHFMLRLN